MAKTKKLPLEKMLSKLNSMQEHLDQARIEVGLYEQRKDYDKKGIAYEFYRLQECLDQAMIDAGLEPVYGQGSKTRKRRNSNSCECDHYPPLSDLGW